MIIQYDSEEDRSGLGHGASLIQDIYSRQAEPFIDVRNERVRHQALGALEQQYLYSRLKADDMPAQKVKSVYTRVPPLGSLLSYEAADSHLTTILDNMKELVADTSLGIAGLVSGANRATRRNLRKIGTDLASLKQVVVGVTMALIGWLAALDFSWMHARYTAAAGVISRPAKAVKGVKTTVPVLLILLVITLSIVGWFTMPHPTGNGGAQQQGGSQAPNHSRQASSQSKASLSNLKSTANKTQQPISGAASPASAPATNTILPAPVSNVLPSASVGGYGGGSVISTSPTPTPSVTTTPTPVSSPTPVPSPAPAPTPVPSTTVTIPATSVNVGGQPLVSTGSTGISLP